MLVNATALNGYRLLAASISWLLIAVPCWAQSTTRDLTIEQRPIADLSVPETQLRITAWVDRQNDSYRAGDSVQLFVKTNRDAYLTVIDVGTSGKVHVLFPNKYSKDNRILAHQVLQIPAPDAPYRIRVGGPTGHELIKIIATTQPGELIRADQLAELGPFSAYRGDTQSLTRDLGIELNQRHTSAPEGGAATFNKVLRITADGATLLAPSGSPSSAALSGEDLYRLGEASFYGDGGSPNYRDALRYFAAAAEAGHVGAMFRIGRIHEAGMDVDQDLSLAMRWYRKSADLGNTHAMVRLALILARSDPPQRNAPEMVRWLKKAAAQGDGMAMMHLGKIYDDGIGLARAPNEAARHLLAALKTGAWTVLDQVAKFSDETRRGVQAQLREAGFYAGSIDGRIGPETRAAMVEFARTGA
jgi:TPR repeat protein